MANPVCMDINMLDTREKKKDYMIQLNSICTQKEIARIFNVSRSTVGNIIHGRTFENKKRIYKDVKCPKCGKVKTVRSDYKSLYCVSCGKAKAWDGKRLSDVIKRKCIRCGKVIEMQRKSWIRGTKMCKSCRPSVNNCKNYKIDEATFNSLFGGYKNRSRKRGIKFNLTKEEFRDITNKNCYYCGAKPKNIKKSFYNRGDYIYNGIDRVDNNKGYEKDNIVPCCKDCNYAKNKLEKKEFINLVKRIYDNLKNKGEI